MRVSLQIRWPDEPCVYGIDRPVASLGLRNFLEIYISIRAAFPRRAVDCSHWGLAFPMELWIDLSALSSVGWGGNQEPRF